MFTKPSPRPITVADQQATIEQRFSELRALIEAPVDPNAQHRMSEIEIQYRNCLMDNIREGAIFFDVDGRISSWNRGAELITGLSAANMIGTDLTAELIGLRDPDGESLPHGDCPFSGCVQSQKKSVREFGLVGRSGREVQIELTVVPVIRQKKCLGAVAVLHDLSANADLKQQLSDLYNASVLDPLTHVANRAEFEKHLREYVKAHRAAQSRCCIIVADIDYFKQVNDTYGHHIGDQALIAFASALKKFVRSRDVVARYGGEEFVILCANCDIDGAVERAEQIRMNLNRTPQQMLNGKTISASFGVSEMRVGEDVTDFFVRADKALYAAKQLGRNRVERARDEDDPNLPATKNFEKSPATGVCWRRLSPEFLYSEEFKTTTPTSLLINKVRGFVSETEAVIRECDTDYTSITVPGIDRQNPFRKTHFRVDIEVCDAVHAKEGLPINYLRITIFPPRPRLFRRIHADLHLQVASELRRYLMLSDETSCVKLNPAATTSGRDNNGG